MQAPEQPPMLHDVTYRKVKESGKVCIENVPPEEFLISRRAKRVEDSPYTAHRVRKTLSDLIAEGYDREQVMGLSGDDAMLLQGEAVTRDKNDNATSQDLSEREGVMREVWVTESYLKVDWDGDGIAEMRKVTTAGTGNEILKKDGKADNVEWDGPPPFPTICPIIQPHKWAGLSIADIVGDLQIIKSVLWRQMLDNLYLVNEPGKIVSDQVELEDLLDRRIGRVVRLKNGARPGDGHVENETVEFMAGQSFQMLEYIDTVRENRTGVTRYNQGLDANSLNKTATGINAITQAAQQRIELIARIFAETGVKDIFKQILRLVTKYQSDKRVVRLRNEWVPMDPNEWNTEYDVTVNVGLGTGNKDQMAMHLMNLLNIQMQGIQMQGGIDGPLITGENVYNSIEKLIENMGLKSPERYVSDPSKAPPKQPQPDPEMVKIQQQGQQAQAELTLKGQIEQAKMQMESANAEQKLALEREIAMLNYQLEQAKTAATIHLQQQKQQEDGAIKRDAAMERAKPQNQVIIGADGKAADVTDAANALAGHVSQSTDTMQQMLAAFIQMQAKRDESQDRMMQALAQLLTAPKEIVRGADGRAQGVRTVLQ